MKLNPEKCITLRCTRSPTPCHAVYLIDKQPLQVVDQYTYLGVKLHSSMTCMVPSYPGNCKCFSFVKRTLYHYDAKVKATAYSTLVRPTLEYTTAVWDPYQQYLINSIEMVQQRAAR